MAILDAPERITKALQVVKTLEERLVTAMNHTGKFNNAHIRAAGVLAQAIKALSAEQRLWADQLKEHASTASQEDRIKAAVSYLLSLPVGPRDAAYAALAAAEAVSLQPLALTYEPPK